jgi:hypothetical protein
MDRRAHGYGSDDYLSLTVLGGRNPMAEGDSSAETILTYWLLHDVCKELGARQMSSHEFADGNIHRQIVRFGDDAMVWVNRGKDDWKVAGVALPPFGFVANARAIEPRTKRVTEIRAEVRRRDGVVCGYAESGDVIFVDARPARGSFAEANAERKVVDFGPVATNGAFQMTTHNRGADGWVDIIMLPGCPASEIRWPVSRSGSKFRSAGRFEILNADGTRTGTVETKQSGDYVIFNTRPEDFGYSFWWGLIRE